MLRPKARQAWTKSDQAAGNTRITIVTKHHDVTPWTKSV